MQQLVTSYFLQSKVCPLPGLGNLYITTTEASEHLIDKIIKPSITTIQFAADEINNADNLIKFIAVNTNNNIQEATDALYNFCKNLKDRIVRNNSAEIDGIGIFILDALGKIQFIEEQLPPAFIKSVKAERVIYPNAEHTILVGDKESTNIKMTKYFNDVPIKKDYWWIWAVILGIIAITLIIIYLNDKGSSSIFGNATGI